MARGGVSKHGGIVIEHSAFPLSRTSAERPGSLLREEPIDMTRIIGGAQVAIPESVKVRVLIPHLMTNAGTLAERGAVISVTERQALHMVTSGQVVRVDGASPTKEEKVAKEEKEPEAPMSPATTPAQGNRNRR